MVQTSRFLVFKDEYFLPTIQKCPQTGIKREIFDLQSNAFTSETHPGQFLLNITCLRSVGTFIIKFD